jgi:hypothetical protein
MMMSTLAEILFFDWVTLTEHCWVIFRERRRVYRLTASDSWMYAIPS